MKIRSINIEQTHFVELINFSPYSSTPLLNKDDLISEWAIFKRALLQERDKIMKSKSLEKAPEF